MPQRPTPRDSTGSSSGPRDPSRGLSTLAGTKLSNSLQHARRLLSRCPSDDAAWGDRSTPSRERPCEHLAQNACTRRSHFPDHVTCFRSTLPSASLKPRQNVPDLVAARLAPEIDPGDPQPLHLTRRDLEPIA